MLILPAAFRRPLNPDQSINDCSAAVLGPLSDCIAQEMSSPGLEYNSWRVGAPLVLWSFRLSQYVGCLRVASAGRPSSR